tara:strand:+ start:406 stop:750 length:345 start_codon:yes stop_codon:yes gene_type:complete
MYQINIISYLDRDTNYIKILEISPRPKGKLLNIVKQIKANKLSQFESYNPCRNQCLYAIMNPNNINEILCIDNLPIFINFLLSNGYTINESLTRLLKKSNLTSGGELLFYISEN